MNSSLTEEQLAEVERLLKECTLGKVKERYFHYTMIPFLPEYYITTQYIFDKFGICDANVLFDKDGNPHVKVNLASEIITKKEYPHLTINKIDNNEPITIDNIKSVELALDEPVYMKLLVPQELNYQ